MALSDDIRRKVVELLASKVSLSDFEDWIAAETWNVHRDDDADAAAPLAYKIELLLSELSGGYRTEADVRGSFVRLLEDRWADSSVLEAVLTQQVVSGADTAHAKVPA